MLKIQASENQNFIPINDQNWSLEQGHGTGGNTRLGSIEPC